MNRINYQELLEQLREAGSKGRALQFDTLIIGIYIGRNKGRPLFGQFFENLIILNNLIESGLTDSKVKNNLYDEYLNNPQCDLFHLIRLTISQIQKNDYFFDQKKQINQNDQQIIEKYQEKPKLFDRKLIEENNQGRGIQVDSKKKSVKLQMQDQISQKHKILNQQQDNFQLQYEKEQNQFQNEKEIQLDNQECQICLNYLTIQNMYPLQCGHIFHRNCLNQYLQILIDERKNDFICANHECKALINNQDLFQCLEIDQIKKYQEYSFKNLIDFEKDLTWCLTPDCKYAFAFEKSDIRFLCPICKNEYCLNCRVKYHKFQTCKEYQVSNKLAKNEQDFVQFAQNFFMRQCPNCSSWTEKINGCDHMTCKCRYEFCYKCGGKYKFCLCVSSKQSA